MNHYLQDYERLVDRLIASHPSQEAMELAVGGAFNPVGDCEVKILKHYGLKSDSFVIDVGCGSGRLSQALIRADWHGYYYGTDIERRLITYAKDNCFSTRAYWGFGVVDGLTIPKKDADFVCFFSVLTHLKPEESYVYLGEAKDALKPGGRILVTSLDYAVNWDVFEAMVNHTRRRSVQDHLNTFLHQDDLVYWSSKLGLRIVDLRPADDKEFGPGQALCVLEK